MRENSRSLRKIYWQDIRHEFAKINPELTKIIDNIDPSKDYPLYLATYQFGDLIVDNGVTYVPDKQGKLVNFDDINLSTQIKANLAYTSIPLFMVTKNASEVFLNNLSRTIPLNLFYPGKLLGLFETLDYLFNRSSIAKWCVSAGARNLFTLPKINEELGFKRLKMAYNLDTNLRPRFLKDHWYLFKTIANHKNFSQDWENKVIFFTKNWFDNHSYNLKWFLFKNYIFKHAWTQAQFAISTVGLNLAWENFANAISARKLKPHTYLVDQVKHLMLLAAGKFSGFRAADHSEQVGPLKALQQSLTDIYLLKKYFPTMMHICSIEDEVHLPRYYSLSYPTILEGLPHNQVSTSTVMIDLRDIKHLINTIKPMFKKVENNVWLKTKFAYFHVEMDKYHEILESSQLKIIDQNLLMNFDTNTQREFCTTSQFWRGCIRILNSSATSPG